MARPSATTRRHQRLCPDFSAHHHIRFRRARLRETSCPLLNGYNRLARHGLRFRSHTHFDAVFHGRPALSSTTTRCAPLVANPRNVLGPHSFGKRPILSLLHPAADPE